MVEIINLVSVVVLACNMYSEFLEFYFLMDVRLHLLVITLSDIFF
jgi:hypothetical protein